MTILNFHLYYILYNMCLQFSINEITHVRIFYQTMNSIFVTCNKKKSRFNLNSRRLNCFQYNTYNYTIRCILYSKYTYEKITRKRTQCSNLSKFRGKVKKMPLCLKKKVFDQCVDAKLEH